jgi:Flp pilus assembly protein TadG
MVVIVPFLVFMFVVAADYCRVYYTAQVVNNAARVGALYASRTATAASGVTPQQAAQQAAAAEGVSLSPALKPTDVTVTMTATNAQVTVTYQFQTVSPYLGLPSKINVSATVTMPLSQ